MQEENDQKWLNGLKFAKDLNFTEAQYREALKIIDSPDKANQLVTALLGLSSAKNGEEEGTEISDISHSNTLNINSTQPTTGVQLVDNKTTFVMSSTQGDTCSQSGDSSSSCYSSISSFPTTSKHSSLESLQLRKIYIDGSNVARTHGKDSTFSWLGIKLCVDWFYSRQHYVKIFILSDRCKHHQADESIISYLYKINALVKTPTGCNDDFFIIEAAKQNNGVIVSNDLYRDEKRFNHELQNFIHFNRLPYVFVDDLFIPANDPLGRTGPCLEDFLKESYKSNQRYQRKNSHTCHPNNPQRLQIKRACTVAYGNSKSN